MIHDTDIVDSVAETLRKTANWDLRRRLAVFANDLDYENAGLEDCIDKREYQLAADKIVCVYQTARHIVKLLDAQCPKIKEYWQAGGDGR